ncbi:solute carrier family 23 member 1-like [Babylonia areolata]|uniref:solute carrier family 23 member 1-like n=1 Tax=Babylonia areolata TaxID=304850 RepID=UPI003FD0E879
MRFDMGKKQQHNGKHNTAAAEQEEAEKNADASKELLPVTDGDGQVDSTDSSDQQSGEEDGPLRYTITQTPPIPVCVFVALQHVLVSLTSALTMSTVIADSLCVDASHSIRAQLFASTLFMSGVCTVMQTSIGVRLPVFQGPSSSFLVPLVGMSTLPGWRCTDHSANATLTPQDNFDMLNTTSANPTTSLSYTMDEKLQQLSGSLMMASVVEVLVGGLGLIRPLMRLIGPLTVAPTISLIGLSLFKLPVVYSKYNPAIALTSTMLVVVFSLYMSRFRLPMPTCSKGGKRESIRVFQLFPILLAMAVMWAVSGILTVAGVFPDDKDHVFYLSRTDARTDIIHGTPWFYVPYPGQFGPPSISIAATVGFVSAVVASLVESVGDYLAAARCCKVMTPPNHAISRGILVEGVGSFLSGAVGAAHATTSFSGNIAMLRLSRTASRSVMVLVGFCCISFSVVGKVGATMATLPPPVIGGIMIVILALLTSMGLSTLTYVDMASNRNLLIIGTALVSGLSVPEFVEQHGDMLETGNVSVDQTVRIVLGTPMFLGGFIALVLDNTVPGTDAERGMLGWKMSHHSADVGTTTAMENPGNHRKEQRPDLDSKPTAETFPSPSSPSSSSAAAAATSPPSVLPRSSSRLESPLTEDEVYGFRCLRDRLGHPLWRYVSFLPHTSKPGSSEPLP